jgi:hypothetical protein
MAKNVNRDIEHRHLNWYGYPFLRSIVLPWWMYLNIDIIDRISENALVLGAEIESVCNAWAYVGTWTLKLLFSVSINMRKTILGHINVTQLALLMVKSKSF